MIKGFSRGGVLTIFSATVIVTLGTLSAKAIGFGKDLFVAYEVGPGSQLDAFLFAYVFPTILISVVGGSLLAAFVPQFLETSTRRSPEEAANIGSEAAALVGVAQLVLTLILIPAFMFIVPSLTGGFDPATRQLARDLIPILMPVVLLNSISGCWSGMLNARGRFGAVAFVPVITPIMMVVALFGLPVAVPEAYRLAFGVVAGALIEFALLASRTRRISVPLFRIPTSWRPEYTAMLRQFWPAALSSLLMSVTLLIDQSFAAHLPEGSVSALSYGTRLTNMTSTVLVTVISAVALPAFSRLVAERRTRDLKRAFGLGVCGILLVAVPFSLICSLTSRWLIDLMFLRGEFSASDASIAASVQAMHAWHVPVYAIGMLAVRGLSAMRATWLMLVGSSLSVVVDLLVNTFGVPEYGVAAIGFATTAMYTVSAAFLAGAFLLLARRTK